MRHNAARGSACRAVCLCVCLVICARCFSEPAAFEPDPYDFSEVPQWAKDVRRAEIITLGSLPFVTLGVTLSYSLYRYFSHGMDAAYFPNPFAQSSDAAHLSVSEQIGIICTAAGISLAIGITDFLWNYIERKIQEKQDSEAAAGVTVLPAAGAAETDSPAAAVPELKE